jgi:dihydrofolate reductase
MKTSRVRVYIASSFDGFIAGRDDDLSWLPHGEGETATPGALDYDTFITDVRALLMGRRTYDVVRRREVPWPYGPRPVLVATHRSLDPHPPETVRPVRGTIGELIRMAKEAAGQGDVYLDGGTLIRQAAEEDLIDEFTVTLAPIVLGTGHPLFAGMRTQYHLEIVSHHSFTSGMLQVRARPARR